MTDLKEKKKEFLRLFTNEQNPLLNKNLRQSVNDTIESAELPNLKTEAWKHTNLDKLFKHQYVKAEKSFVPKDVVNTFSFKNLDSDTLVFVNGFFNQEHSKVTQSDKHIFIGSLNDAVGEHPSLIEKYYCSTKIHQNNLFSAINTAFSEDGSFIFIPDNVVLEKPIHIMSFINGNNLKTFSQARNLIVVGKNSQLKIIQSFHSLSTDFTINNVGTEFILDDHSSIDYFLMEGEGNSAGHFNTVFVNQNTGSNFKANTSTLCGSLVRNEIHVDYLGEHCETDLQGIYLPDKNQHFDNYIHIKHSKPNCRSSQNYKGIIDNQAESVFTGKVYVARDAQKTDAKQSNKNLLLTDNAKAHSRPQLEIYADDVICAHGSTTGQIDKEALFYLKTRGISEQKAKTLLMTAFIGDIVDKIEIKPYKEYINYLVNKRLKGQKIEGLCSLKICPNC